LRHPRLFTPFPRPRIALIGQLGPDLRTSDHRDRGPAQPCVALAFPV